MNFRQVHKLFSYLLVASGFFPLLLSETLHPVVWPVSLLGLVWSWFMEPPQIERATYRHLWTTATLFVIGLFSLSALLGMGPNPVLLAAYILVVLQLNKLFNRKANRDYLQLYVLSFLMLTLGTILNNSLSYAFSFAFYLVFVTWTLIVFHLRREIEETYLMRHRDDLDGSEKVEVERILNSRRIVSRSFLATTSLVALLLFSLTGAFFLLFPRIGFGLFFRQQRSGTQVAGFSNTVRLGSMGGTIQGNRKVVFRVEFPQGHSGKHLNYYWRGTSFDYYDGQSWKRSKRKKRIVRFLAPRFYILREAEKEERLVEQVIYQEPLDTNLLFGIDRVYEVALSGRYRLQLTRNYPRLRVGAYSGEITYGHLPRMESSFQYTVYSQPDPPRERRSRLSSQMKKALRTLYLQLPPGDHKRVGALARRIVRGKRKRAEQVKAVLRYLRTNYRYSLTRRAARRFPLEDFLFVQKKGHCEYFSTAMIILLRHLQIPARQVTGFYGGSWNPYGEYYVIRHGNAHSWVEVFFPRRGWLRFDPTPSGPRGRASLWNDLGLWVDALRLRWHKWIIEYDLVHQIRAIKFLRNHFRSVGQQLSGDPYRPQTKRSLGQLWRRLWLWFALLGGGVLLGLFLWYRKRRPASTRQLASHSTRLYQRLLRLLARAGYPREPQETPHEFLQRLAADQPKWKAPLQQITDLYLKLRFGPPSPPPTLLPQLQQQIADFTASLQNK